MKETKDIMPFFRRREQLAAFIGGRFPELLKRNRIAFEYDLFGDFSCDLVIGCRERKTYCFVEFEEGATNSIFHKVAKKSTLEWSPRFEHGFSQIVDWFWKLDEMRPTPEYVDRFGAARIDVYGLLVVGRDEGLDSKQQRRLKWREEKVLVDSHRIHCVTFDELYNDMEFRLNENLAKKE